MGTRSTTKIYEDGRLLLALYKQYDGYPDGWGQQIKDFFHKGVFVNGIRRGDDKLQFNGVGDFALLLIKEFKEGTGDLYLTTEENQQEYNYIIEFNYDPKSWGKMTYSLKCQEDESYFEEGLITIE